MNIPLFDPSRQSPELRKAVKEAVDRVLDHQQFILGKEVVAFEEEIAAACLQLQLPTSTAAKPHAIGVSSGTDGLLALLMAQEIGAGDAVITTPYTFFATAGCIHRVGAEILFCDIDPQTYMMDPKKLEELLSSCARDPQGALRSARGNRVRMIIPIHLFGTCCDMDAIMALAKKYDLLVIEDAAQVIGADYPSKDGAKKAGAIAEMSYFSFYPTKNLGAAGDAGLAVCLNLPSHSTAAANCGVAPVLESSSTSCTLRFSAPEASSTSSAAANVETGSQLAKKVRLLRNHGMEERYYNKHVGGNFRLDGLQAAILRAKLPFLETWSEQRRVNAALYRAAFMKVGLLDRITLPFEPFAASGFKNHHIYHQYVIRIAGGAREKVIAHLKEKNIGHAIYYPVALHLQECFAYLGYAPGAFPESERAALESLALPIYPELREDEINAVVAAIAEALS